MEKGIVCNVDEKQRCLGDEGSSLSSAPSSTCQGESCCQHRRRSERWPVLHIVHAIVTVILIAGLIAIYCQHQRDMVAMRQMCSSASPAPPPPSPAALQLDHQPFDYQERDSTEDDTRARRAPPKRKSDDRPEPFSDRQTRKIKQLIKQNCPCTGSPPSLPLTTTTVISPSSTPSSATMVGRTVHLVMKESNNKANSAGIFDNFYVLLSSSWKSWHPFYKELDGRLEVPEDGLYAVYGQMTYSDNKSVDTLVIERQPFNAHEATHEVVSCSSIINPKNEQGTKIVTCTFYTVARLHHRDRLQFIDKYGKSYESPRLFRTDHASSFWGVMWMAV